MPRDQKICDVENIPDYTVLVDRPVPKNLTCDVITTMECIVVIAILYGPMPSVPSPMGSRTLHVEYEV